MSLKQRLRDQEPLIGTFLKTPSAMVCEVFGRSDLDLICLDAEHSAFDRRDINDCVLALQQVGTPSLVRVPANRPEYILNALDCGATGVLVPHVIRVSKGGTVFDKSAKRIPFIGGNFCPAFKICIKCVLFIAII